MCVCVCSVCMERTSELYSLTYNSITLIPGADLGTVKTCEMCKQSLLIDLDDFNMTEFYHKHQQSRVRHIPANFSLV